MTKVVNRIVKCAKCGTESNQLIVCSVNFRLGSREDNESLIKHQQVCPKCNYSNFDISNLTNNEEKKKV